MSYTTLERWRRDLGIAPTGASMSKISMVLYSDWAAIVPMANEAAEFDEFIATVRMVLDRIGTGKFYFVIDKATKDNTLELSQKASAEDPRLVTIWSPENRNVVDAYLKGLRVAYEAGHELIIEMDAGLSHDPRAIPMFLRVLNEGNECAFGSRFTNGGSMGTSPFNRRMLSHVGTWMSNWLLGTKMFDMTSGFQGFHREVVGRVLAYPFLSKAHFYQTEMRYLLRKCRFAEIPIHYTAPSKSVSQNAIKNAVSTLGYYFRKRLAWQPVSL